MFSKKTHKEYIERENERIKERRELLKKATPREEAQNAIMWHDTDVAGRQQYKRNQRLSGIVGAAAGAATGAAVGQLGSAKKLGKGKKALIITGGVITGNTIAKRITHRKNEKVRDEIWEKGDKEALDYLKSTPKEKRKIEKDYIPIGNRTDRKGNYFEGGDSLPYDKSKNKARLDDIESAVRINRKMKKEVEKENKRREKK